MADEYNGPVTVEANDGTQNTLDNINVWGQSNMLVEMVKDTDPGNTIPLAGVSPGALDKTVEYMNQMAKWKEESPTEEDRKKWIDDYKEGLAPQDQLSLLFQTITAANFMELNSLLDELCKIIFPLP